MMNRLIRLFPRLVSTTLYRGPEGTGNGSRARRQRWRECPPRPAGCQRPRDTEDLVSAACVWGEHQSVAHGRRGRHWHVETEFPKPRPPARGRTRHIVTVSDGSPQTPPRSFGHVCLVSPARVPAVSVDPVHLQSVGVSPPRHCDLRLHTRDARGSPGVCPPSHRSEVSCGAPVRAWVGQGRFRPI